MDKEEYADWLKSLKSGDKVCYRPYRDKTVVFDEVVKITPSGIILLKSGKSTNNEGYYRSRNNWDRPFSVKPITQDILDEIRMLEVIGMLKDFDYSTLSKEQLEGIMEIIEGVEE